MNLLEAPVPLNFNKMKMEFRFVNPILHVLIKATDFIYHYNFGFLYNTNDIEPIAFSHHLSLYSFRHSSRKCNSFSVRIHSVPHLLSGSDSWKISNKCATQFPHLSLLLKRYPSPSSGPVKFNSLHVQMSCVINTFLIISISGLGRRWRLRRKPIP